MLRGCVEGVIFCLKQVTRTEIKKRDIFVF